jgi:hypothetical protein
MTIRLAPLLILALLAAPAAAQPGNQPPAPPPAQPGQAPLPPPVAQPGEAAPLPPPVAQPGEAAPLPPPVAQPGAEMPAPAPPPDRAWYGWQILIADGLALVGGTVLAEVSDLEGERGFGDQVSATWALGMFGSMAVHGANRRPLASLASVSQRLIIPPVASVFGIAGYCLAAEIADGCAGTGARWGFAAGVGAAALIDALALSQNRLGGSQGWYGSSVLAVDALGLGLGLFSLGRVDDGDRIDDVLALGASHYVVSMFGAPWVHGANGHWLRALGSFGIRSLTPGLLAAGGVVGYCAASGGSNGCSNHGAAFGLALGSLLAATLDVTVLAWDEHRTPSRAWSPRVVPYVRPGLRDGMEAGFLIDL